MVLLKGGADLVVTQKGPSAGTELIHPGLRSSWVVRLGATRTHGDLDRFRRDFEALDFSQTPEEMFAILRQYMTPPGTFFDSFPLHFVSTNALAYLESQGGVDADVRRFRPNRLLEFFDTDEPGAEFGLVGKTVRVGDVTITPQGQTIRCSIPSRPQSVQGLDAAPGMTRAIVDLMKRHVGVYANIETPGVIAVGDEVFVS